MYKNVKYPSARYCQRNKESIQGGSRKKHQIHSEKEKVKKQQYGHERYQKPSENEKQKLVDCRKRYYEKLKNKSWCSLYYQKKNKHTHTHRKNYFCLFQLSQIKFLGAR